MAASRSIHRKEPLGVSCVICSYNGAERLPKTLAHIFRQVVAPGIKWELIVVDNASTDGTAKIAQDFCQKESPIALRVVAEPRKGLSHARHRGFLEARYPIVTFIDDDMSVGSDWVQIVSELFTEQSECGALGGFGEAVFECEPPAWFDTYKDRYVVGPQGDITGDITHTQRLLWGAGLSIRKSAWQNLIKNGFQQLLVDRMGNELTCGGDSELCLAVAMSGWQIWYEPALRYQHYLPKERLSWPYLRRWWRGFGAASVGIDAYVMARDLRYDTLIDRIRQGINWKILAASLKLVRRELLNMKPRTDGDECLLKTEFLIGRLRELWRNYRFHDTRVARVREAPWRVVKHELSECQTETTVDLTAPV